MKLVFYKLLSGKFLHSPGSSQEEEVELLVHGHLLSSSLPSRQDWFLTYIYIEDIICFLLGFFFATGGLQKKKRIVQP